MAHPRGLPTNFNGIRYRSKFEAEIAQDLTDRAIQFRYEATRLPYEQPSIYVSDFTLPHGVVIEAKGRLTPQDRRKLLDVKRAHPELDLRLLFQRASNKLDRRKRSLTYGQWATRHGFMWAEGTIPKEWILSGQYSDD